MKQKYFSDGDVKNCVLDIFRQMYLDHFKPDLVIGLVRGGAVPATMLSHLLDVPCYLVNKDEQTHILPGFTNAIVIDDINDTGKAMTDIYNYLSHDYDGNIKYAALISNSTSSFELDYFGVDINKLDDPCWVIFPWENWWKSSPNSSD